MGRSKKSRKGKNNPDNKNRMPKKDTERKHYKFEEIVKENAKFTEFYQKQNIMPSEEFDQFLAAFQRPLPQTFRFAGFKNSSKLLISRMKNKFLENFEDLEIEGEQISKPAPMPWYPSNLAWTTTLSRPQLRRHPKLGQMHRFLVTESEAGYVTRQEAVSMIPPLFMDIQSDHKILDLCAAPGSKTSQIIEMMHEYHNNLPESEKSGPYGKIPNGFCIANDRNNKRCYMLVHQAKRLNSPTCIITNHDAAQFPGLCTKDKESGEIVPLEFDRILADVPCTGDGTLRKNFDIWASWTPENSMSLHATQVKILKRALELLKVGGKVIYSTCSLSPIEDEAVVGHVLHLCNGSAKLIDCSDKMPELKRQKGISKWKIMKTEGTWYETFEEMQAEHASKTHITKSMFPPENVKDLNLDRCMRYLPHHQDTGGFFVCVIEKTAKLPWESNKSKAVIKFNQNKVDTPNGSEKNSNETPKFENANKEGENDDDEPPMKRTKVVEKYRQGAFTEDPFYFFNDPKNHVTLKEICEFFSIDINNFPVDLLLSRCDNETHLTPRHIYLVSPSVKDLLLYNSKRLYLINSGVRFFTKTNLANIHHPYRVTNDSLDTLAKYLNFRQHDRCIGISQEDMAVLLQTEYPDFSKYSEEMKAKHNLMKGKIGSTIAFLKDPIEIIDDQDDKIVHQVPMYLTAWRGETYEKESFRAYIDRYDRRHYMHLLGCDIPEEVDMPKSKLREKQEQIETAVTTTDGPKVEVKVE